MLRDMADRRSKDRASFISNMEKIHKATSGSGGQPTRFKRVKTLMRAAASGTSSEQDEQTVRV